MIVRKIIYIIDDEKSAQFRYQVKNVAEATNDSGRYEVVWFLKSETKKINRCLDETSLIVVERQTAKDDMIPDLIKGAHKKGIKVLFSLDDLVFDYRDLLVLMKSTNSKNIFYWMGYFWGIRRIAKKVDGFLCTNGFLAEKLKRSFNKPVRVIPNSLNQKQIEVSEKWVNKLKGTNKVEKPFDEQKSFVIGYFSGSPTHTKDFRLIEPELVKFLTMHKNAKLKVVGDMKFSYEMKKWIEKGRVEISNKVDYLRLQGLMARVDVNIAPLLINDFTNCKSELKFFEAAVAETTTIASPTYAFEKAITDGKNGFLARQGEWYDKLEYLYQHPEENRKIALAAKKYALKHYIGTEFLKEVEAAYEYFVK